MALRLICLVDESGTLISEYPPGVLKEALLVGGFIKTLDALSQVSGVKNIRMISSSDFIGYLYPLEKNCRAFFIFDPPPKFDKEKFLRPFLEYMAAELNALIKKIKISAGLIDQDVIAKTTPVLKRLCFNVNKILEEITSVDNTLYALFDKYKERAYLMIQNVCRRYDSKFFCDEDGIYLLRIDSVEKVFSTLSELTKGLEEYIVEIPATRERFSKIESSILDHFMKIQKEFGDDTEKIITSILAGRSIVGVGSEGWKEVFIRALELFRPIPYIYSEDINMLFIKQIPAVVYTSRKTKILEKLSHVVLVDFNSGRVKNAYSSLIGRKIYQNILSLMEMGVPPHDIIAKISEYVSEIKVAVEMICDICIPPKPIEHGTIVSNILSFLKRYKDPNTIKLIFSVATKVFPEHKLEMYKLYKECFKKIFPVGTLVE